jgi:hypothetical protein
MAAEMRYRDMEGKYPALDVLLSSYSDAFKNDLRINYNFPYNPSSENKLFTTSAYGLAEYRSGSFGAELGLRLDHFYQIGEGFSLQSKPALNPRLNIDYNVFKDKWILKSFDISAGTGLFSSVNSMVSAAEKKYGITEIKPNRSWTSVLGGKLEFPESLSLNIEGYYKYVFDRTYIPLTYNPDGVDVQPKFDGEGMVWGIDVMAQKLHARYWDGWISYSFSWAKYRDPGAGSASAGISGGYRGDDWYFPSYHRFHNLNLVLNIKPAPRFNIYFRFGFASGQQLSKRIGSGPETRPVLVYDSKNPANSKIIEKFYWPSVPDENNRTTPSLPLDIKFSILSGNEKGKSRCEIYFALENTLALLYSAQGNTSYNAYTGEVDTGSTSASYEIPIPVPSFGVKLSY